MGGALSSPAGTRATWPKPLSCPRSWQCYLYCWSCGDTLKTWQHVYPTGKVGVKQVTSKCGMAQFLCHCHSCKAIEPLMWEEGKNIHTPPYTFLMHLFMKCVAYSIQEFEYAKKRWSDRARAGCLVLFACGAWWKSLSCIEKHSAVAEG